MVVHYPRTVWKNCYAEHEVVVKQTIKKNGDCVPVNQCRGVRGGFRFLTRGEGTFTNVYILTRVLHLKGKILVKIEKHVSTLKTPLLMLCAWTFFS